MINVLMNTRVNNDSFELIHCYLTAEIELIKLVIKHSIGTSDPNMVFTRVQTGLV